MATAKEFSALCSEDQEDTEIMTTAEQLLELIFSWFDERECFADELRELAKELESIREKCNAGECVGSSLQVLGSAGMILAGVDTLLTGGAFTSLLNLSCTASNVGTGICVITKILDNFLSCRTMKKVLDIEKKSNEIAEKINQLFQKLKSEKEVKFFAEPDELERHIKAVHIRIDRGGGSSSAGVRQRSEGHFRDWPDTFDTKDTDLREICLGGTDPQMLILSVLGYLSVNSLMTFSKHKWMETKLFDTVKQLNFLSMSTTGLGTAMVVGGFASMACALPVMIDNWRKMIKGNHVTKASKSLRDTADEVKILIPKLRKLARKNRKILKKIKMLMLQKIEETKEEEEEEDPTAVRAALLNVRSIKQLKDKRLKIRNLIEQNNLDVFLTTETWLENETAAEALREASPPNFEFYQQSRDGRNGGGVAIQFSTALQDQRIDLGSFPDVEYVATALKHEEWDRAILFINLYRPPKTPDKTKSEEQKFYEFIAAFRTLVEVASSRYTSIVVTGDFNIHVEMPYTDRTMILEVNFRMLDLDMYLNLPTHRSGGTLDLVLGRNVKISQVKICDDRISDHYTIYFSTRPT